MDDVLAGHYVAGLVGAAMLRHWYRDGTENAQRTAELREVMAGLGEFPLSMPMNPERRELLPGYAEWAETYDGPNPLVATEQPVIHAVLEGLVDESTVALDAGCGTGRHAEFLAGLGASVIGVDQSAEMLSVAREKLPEVDFRVGEFEELPVDDASVDLAVSSLALCHLADPAAAIAEIARVLRPGGRLVISDPHPASAQVGGQAFYGFGDGGPIRWVENHYHQASSWLRAFMAAGLDLVEVRELTFTDEQMLASPAAPLVPDALRALLDGIPSLWIWVVERPGRPPAGAGDASSPGDAVVEWRGAFISDEANALHAEAFDTRVFTTEEWDWVALAERHSLGWVTARREGELVGFVNVVWDGLVHAWLQDVMVATSARHEGIGVAMVRAAADEARRAGCEWLHVDFDDDLRRFYLDACGFTETNAGLIDLTD